MIYFKYTNTEQLKSIGWEINTSYKWQKKTDVNMLISDKVTKEGHFKMIKGQFI